MLEAIDGARETICFETFIDEPLVRQASCAGWDELLAAGTAISEYQPTILHMKALVVDSSFVSVGSTNFDNHSFLLNDEANLNVIAPDLAQTMRDLFKVDWAKGMPVALQAWRQRPRHQKLRERMAVLLSSQLQRRTPTERASVLQAAAGSADASSRDGRRT